MDLKELERRDLGGGIVLRRVLPVGGVVRQAHPGGRPRLRDPRPFYIVTLLWREAALQGDVQDLARAVAPAGLVEARVYPPRPEDGPDGEGWVVTDCPGDAARKGRFPTLESALEAVVADLRAFDASRRLGGEEHWP